MTDNPSQHPQAYPSVVTKEVAQTLMCNRIYEAAKYYIGKSTVTLFVTGCELVNVSEFKRVGTRFRIPDNFASLSAFCPEGFTHYVVEAECWSSRLEPDTLMTRGEFLVELLGIWEGLKAKLPMGLGGTLDKEIDLVIEYTKNAYSARELMNMEYLRDMGGV